MSWEKFNVRDWCYFHHLKNLIKPGPWFRFSSPTPINKVLLKTIMDYLIDHTEFIHLPPDIWPLIMLYAIQINDVLLIKRLLNCDLSEELQYFLLKHLGLEELILEYVNWPKENADLNQMKLKKDIFAIFWEIPNLLDEPSWCSRGWVKDLNGTLTLI